MNCQGKRIAFTGIASGYDRPDIHAAIVSAGGMVDNAVTRRTDLLVVGENPGNGTGKRDAAAKLGVPTMMAQAFMNAINGGGTIPFFARPEARKPKKKAAVPKVVTQAISDLAKQKSMTGFVGF